MPSYILLIDDSRASDKAQQALRDAGVHFIAEKLASRQDGLSTLPRLLTQDGSFIGLDKIQYYARNVMRITSAALPVR